MTEEQKTTANFLLAMAAKDDTISKLRRSLEWIVNYNAKYHTDLHCRECPCPGCHMMADDYARYALRALGDA